MWQRAFTMHWESEGASAFALEQCTVVENVTSRTNRLLYIPSCVNPLEQVKNTNIDVRQCTQPETSARVLMHEM